MSTMEKYRRHDMFRPGPSNRQNEYPDFNFNPPPVHSAPRVPTPPAVNLENRSRETESIENEVPNQRLASTYQSGSKHGTQRSHAFGSSLRNEFQNLQSTDLEPTYDTVSVTQSNEFHNKVLMELCDAKYDYIPRETKMDLVEQLLEEYEDQFMESQLGVNQFIEILLQRFKLAQSQRQQNEFLALKRGLKSRETYSRIIRNKKTSKSNSTLNQR